MNRKRKLNNLYLGIFNNEKKSMIGCNNSIDASLNKPKQEDLQTNTNERTDISRNKTSNIKPKEAKESKIFKISIKYSKLIPMNYYERKRSQIQEIFLNPKLHIPFEELSCFETIYDLYEPNRRALNPYICSGSRIKKDRHESTGRDHSQYYSNYNDSAKIPSKVGTGRYCDYNDQKDKKQINFRSPDMIDTNAFKDKSGDDCKEKNIFNDNSNVFDLRDSTEKSNLKQNYKKLFRPPLSDLSNILKK